MACELIAAKLSACVISCIQGLHQVYEQAWQHKSMLPVQSIHVNMFACSFPNTALNEAMACKIPAGADTADMENGCGGTSAALSRS